MRIGTEIWKTQKIKRSADFVFLWLNVNRLVIGAALISGSLSLLICWNVLGLIPHVPDELSYLYQGRILSSGRYYVQPPQVPEAFTTKWDHVFRTPDHWRSMYPPGWPVLLAVGWLIHAPWLVNPVLTGLSVFVGFWLV